MGAYLDRFWHPDGGMNKAERMGGSYHPYLPDMLSDYEPRFSPSCMRAIADAQLLDILLGTPAISIKTAQNLTGKATRRHVRQSTT